MSGTRFKSWQIGVFVWLLAMPARGESPLTMLVMDPLALPLSCACVDGVGQRRYELLASHMESVLKRPVKLLFDESLGLARARVKTPIDLIVGKDAMVRFDAKRESLRVRELAALTDRTGGVDLTGVFLARSDSEIRGIEDLAGRRVALGPKEEAEANFAARQTLGRTGLLERVSLIEAGSLDAAALLLADGETDAAVVSEFLPPLLEGCGKLERGSVVVIGRTAPVPFIRVFATDSMSETDQRKVTDICLKMRSQVELMEALETKGGFLGSVWHDWRGVDRAGMVSWLPASLPLKPRQFWSAALTGPAVAGVAADSRHVLVPDKSADQVHDIFRCLDARNGHPLWTLEYSAPGEMEYSNAPRATPVIHDGLAYLQGAFGHLHCVEMETGRVIWKRNLFDDFGGKILNWGASVSPLVMDDRVIVNPGSARASLAALDRRTGKILWETTGHAAAYSSFVTATVAGGTQVIGYDSAGLGGWNPASGTRLWELVPRGAADFNVLTPVVLGDRVLLGSENNATRLHAFDKSGRIIPEAVSRNGDLAPDTCTPVVVNGKIYATAYGELFCVRLSDMKTLWKKTDDMFYDHSNVMGGPDRVLVWTMAGDLLLLDAGVDEYRLVSHFRPFGDTTLDSMSHPAIVGDRILLRSKERLASFSLRESE